MLEQQQSSPETLIKKINLDSYNWRDVEPLSIKIEFSKLIKCLLQLVLIYAWMNKLFSGKWDSLPIVNLW